MFINFSNPKSEKKTLTGLNGEKVQKGDSEEHMTMRQIYIHCDVDEHAVRDRTESRPEMKNSS